MINMTYIKSNIAHNESMTNENKNCFFCNGFYGPTHGEHICGTCHLFLYTDERNPDLISSVAVLDENDSGNDEPSEGQLTNEKYIKGQGSQDKPSWSSSSCMQRSLYQRVRELSVGTNNNNNNSNSSNNNNNGALSNVDHMARLPPEVFLIIFRHLDTLSLWALSIACTYLTNLINADMPEEKWREKVHRYWPLYKPLYDDSWYTTFSKLVLSAPCKSCIEKMMSDIDEKTTVDMGEIDYIDNSRRLKRLRHDMKTMKNEPPGGVNAVPIDDNYLYWSASIHGPGNSPYEGGVFFLYMQLPYAYPLHPPKIRFITRIFHPNVSRHGDIGLDCIAHNWSLALTIAKILISIQSLLTDPYCKVSMEPAIATLYETDRNAFNRKAIEWTYKYAMTDILPTNTYDLNDFFDNACY